MVGGHLGASHSSIALTFVSWSQLSVWMPRHFNMTSNRDSWRLCSILAGKFYLYKDRNGREAQFSGRRSSDELSPPRGLSNLDADRNLIGFATPPPEMQAKVDELTEMWYEITSNGHCCCPAMTQRSPQRDGPRVATT